MAVYLLRDLQTSRGLSSWRITYPLVFQLPGAPLGQRRRLMSEIGKGALWKRKKTKNRKMFPFIISVEWTDGYFGRLAAATRMDPSMGVLDCPFFTSNICVIFISSILFIFLMGVLLFSSFSTAWRLYENGWVACLLTICLLTHLCF